MDRLRRAASSQESQDSSSSSKSSTPSSSKSKDRKKDTPNSSPCPSVLSLEAYLNDQKARDEQLKKAKGLVKKTKSKSPTNSNSSISPKGYKQPTISSFFSPSPTSSSGPLPRRPPVMEFVDLPKNRKFKISKRLKDEDEDLSTTTTRNKTTGRKNKSRKEDSQQSDGSVASTCNWVTSPINHSQNKDTIPDVNSSSPVRKKNKKEIIENKQETTEDLEEEPEPQLFSTFERMSTSKKGGLKNEKKMKQDSLMPLDSPTLPVDNKKPKKKKLPDLSKIVRDSTQEEDTMSSQSSLMSINSTQSEAVADDENPHSSLRRSKRQIKPRSASESDADSTISSSSHLGSKSKTKKKAKDSQPSIQTLSGSTVGSRISSYDSEFESQIAGSTEEELIEEEESSDDEFNKTIMAAQTNYHSKEVEGMSNFELITNPETLQGGMEIFNDNVNHLESSCTSSESDSSKTSISKRKKIVNGSSAAAEGNTNKSKGKKKGLEDKGGESSDCGARSNLLPVKGGKKEIIPDKNNSDQENLGEQKVDSGAAVAAGANGDAKRTTTKGQAQFGELMRRSRFDLPPSETVLSKRAVDFAKELDLDRKNQLMCSMFVDYEEKDRMYKEHSSVIKQIGCEKIKKCFRKVRKELLDIFEGRDATSIRMQLFLSMDPADRQKLKGLNVSDPFDNSSYMTIVNEILDFLFPKTGRQQYTEYVQLVMVPEALIRIYARVNDISFQQAEKEMKFGPRYDGPIDQKRVLQSKNSKEKESQPQLQSADQIEEDKE